MFLFYFKDEKVSDNLKYTSGGSQISSSREVNQLFKAINLI